MYEPFQRCQIPYYPEWNQSLDRWPWRDIIAEERRVMAYRDKLPKCSLCGRALMLRQQGAHFSCLGYAGSLSGSDAKAF
jgi:hypothetical protein